MSHVAQDREHSEACKDAGATVQGTESNAVSVGTEDVKPFIMWIIQKLEYKAQNKILNSANPKSEAHKVGMYKVFKVQGRGHWLVAVIVVFVIASQSGEDTLTHSIGKKHLGPCVTPNLKKETDRHERERNKREKIGKR